MSRIRAKVAAEILSTEQSYVESLTVLCEVFVEPAKQALSPEEVSGLFSNIAVIASFNKTFLGELQTRLGAWTSESEIADLFDKYAQFLKMYTQYVSNHDAATELLASLSAKNSRFQKLLAAARADPRSKVLELSSYLIMSVL